MQFWTDILNIALLGTEKRPIATTHLPPALNEAAALISQGEAADPEEQFLQLAALSFNFRQSGRKPVHPAVFSFPEAAPEIAPYCSPRAAQVLRDILAEDNLSLLQLWLDRCAAAQRLAPPESIPALLARAVNHKSLCPAVTAVCGRRGEWLGRLNPAWEFSLPVDDEQLWQTGQPEQRKAVLRRMRRQDPVKAREWLSHTWPQENANTRVELLKQLDGSVQPEDEPFLLSLLDEKSQKGKEEAIRLLQQLPGSALVKKYEEAARPLLTLMKEKTLLGMMTKTTLQIVEPVIPEKAAYLPGIDYLSNDKSFSDGEFVLYQLIQHIPPSFWEGHFGEKPDAIIDLFAGPREKYLPAFAKATIRFRDQKWAQLYLGHRDVFYSQLLELLPASQQESYCVKNFKQYAELIIQQAREWPGEWSPALAREIITHTSAHPYQYNISFYKANIARIPPAVAGLLETAGPKETGQIPVWVSMVEQIRRLLSLKEQVQKAFNE